MIPKALVLPILAIFAFQPAADAAGDNASTLSIESTDGRTLARFSPNDLRSSFPQHDLSTATPWSKDGQVFHFRGAYLADVLQKYNLSSGDIEAAAADNYVTTLSATDIATYSPLIAIDIACEPGEPACHEGFKPLDLQQSGPFFIVWPLSQFPEYCRQTKNSLWVWFVVHLRPADK